MPPKSDTAFLKAFTNLIGVEGGFTDNPKDDGNWTGGKQGSGVLKGTKYGIAASSYPHLDIPNLTLEQAQEVYYKDFWMPCKADKLPFPIANALFDCAVNSGVKTAAKLLQRACGIAEDGVIGEITLKVWGTELKTRCPSVVFRHLPPSTEPRCHVVRAWRHSVRAASRS